MMDIIKPGLYDVRLVGSDLKIFDTIRVKTVIYTADGMIMAIISDTGRIFNWANIIWIKPA